MAVHAHIIFLSNVHNISRRRGFLTAYTRLQWTASSTESIPSAVNLISVPISKVLIYFIKRNCVFDILSTSMFWLTAIGKLNCGPPVPYALTVGAFYLF